MNYSKIKTAAFLLVAGACLVTAGTSRGAVQEFWLKAGTTTKTMPGGSPIVTMWGFAQSTDSGATYGPVFVPGPQLDVTAGNTLTIHLANTLQEPVSIIIPGQYGSTSAGQSTPNDPSSAYAGRVRSLTIEAAPGGNQDFTWNNVQPGTFLYHSGSHPSVQVQMGLYGALTVSAGANLAYAGVPFDSQVTLLFSEIDPDVHDAVAGGSFGPGPSFLDGDLTSSATDLVIGLTAHSDPVYAHLWSLLSPDTQAAGVTVATLPDVIKELLGGSSIYSPLMDAYLSPATIALLQQAPEVNQPTETVPYNGFMVRLNRMLLTDTLPHASPAVTLPAINKMTSTIRSYPQYFLVNGQAYDSSIGNNEFTAGTVGSRILLRMLNAGMDAHVPTLQNGGDLQLVAEDGQKAPYVRSSYSVWLPALKTVDAIFVPPGASGVDPCAASATGERFAINDRRLGLVNGTNPNGGMLAYLKVAVPAPTPVTGITVGPVDPTVQDGANVTLTASVSGGYAGIPYVWKKNGTQVGGAGPTLSFVAAYGETPNPAVYTVTVTDCSGVTFSPAAQTSVTVNANPVHITTQPQSVAVAAGNPAQFAVAATGTQPLTFQWQKDSGTGFNNVSSGVVVSTANGSTLSFASVTAADLASYRVVVTGPGPVNSQTSSTVTLSLLAAPAIATQPVSTFTFAGNPLTFATFNVVGGGVPAPTYQWQSGASFANLADIAGVVAGSTTATLTITPPNTFSGIAAYAVNYRVQLANGVGSPLNSSTASLTVLSQPTGFSGFSANTASFTAVGSGAASLDVLPNTVVWQQLVGATWTTLSGTHYSFGKVNLLGTTTYTATINTPRTAADNGSYRVVVTVGSVSQTSNTLVRNQ